MKNNPDDLFLNIDDYMLSEEELHQRYGPLIDRGVESLETINKQSDNAKSCAFFLAGAKLWFVESMRVLKEGMEAAANAAIPPVHEPAIATRGILRGTEERTEREKNGDEKQLHTDKYCAIQEGRGCIGRLEVQEDLRNPRCLRLALEFLTADQQPRAPFWVTVRDSSGKKKINRQRCDDLIFVITNVKPATLSFLLEDETGENRVEFSMKAEQEN